jgi:two-component system, NarL family, response regulator NreC
MAGRLRVAVCDDHSVVRAGLRTILEDDPTIEVVGEAATADEAVALAGAVRPDVFVIDLSLPDESGVSATRRIRQASAETKVLILTMHDDVAYLREAFEAGAAGYVLKKAADMELLLALRTVAAGERYVHPALGAALLDQTSLPVPPRGPAVPELSARESEILRLLALGHTNPEIAGSLHLSVRTVETYRSNIQLKLGVRSRAELARLARESGLLG